MVLRAMNEHVDHNQMNLLHVIREFSFGPHLPDITQPLDNYFEYIDQCFVAYQYFLHVVPKAYIAPRSVPFHIHQYSVTHYTRIMQHNEGTPGIFFKFDLDPLAITQHQRNLPPTPHPLLEVVSGSDQMPGIVATQASRAKVGLRSKWGGGELQALPKSGQMTPIHGSGWVLEGSSTSPYAIYANTPLAGGFPTTPAFPFCGLVVFAPRSSVFQSCFAQPVGSTWSWRDWVPFGTGGVYVRLRA
ncbi:hypothetical protein K443DRAFT_11693 [Laccaria amethystina LaAM-08-1]|uniref:Unplaced genomic scaffold K443scaffold_236, whole genome shotgun sequence n=1 Tax=Laccaria amethystina LaAM-08-1 TaxID=1095629 RepID=A0A0C9WT44_9AGAR|nr:hypothetical protein K443DRAFT_11693 [Laccaria amethystina LaAM-08-1]